MPTKAHASERRALATSAVGALIIGCVGVTFAMITGSQAILLDGVFNVVYFAMGLLSLKVAGLLDLPDDQHFPYGYAYFEPLINGLKGVLVLGVSMLALIDAVMALFQGGRAIEVGAAIGYGAFATIAGWTMALWLRRGARDSGSTMVETDAENWIVNAVVSSGVLMAFVAAYFVQRSGLEHLTPYVDPALVTVIVLFSISIPIRSAWGALLRMLGKAPPPEVVRSVEAVIRDAVEDLPVQEVVVRVTEPGRSRLVLAHVKLPPDYAPPVSMLDRVRTRALDALRAAHSHMVFDMVFTAESQWIDGGMREPAGQEAGPDGDKS